MRAVGGWGGIGTVVAAMLAAGPLVEPATAEPFVGRTTHAVAETRLIGTDGRKHLLSVQVDSWTPTGGATHSVVSVKLRSCTGTGCTATRYVREVGGSELSYAGDMSRVALSMRFLGRPLTATWQLTHTDKGPNVIVEGFGLRSSSTGTTTATTVRLTVLGLTCPTVGSFEGGYLVAPEGYVPPYGTPAPDRTPAHFTPRGRTVPRCD